MTLKLGRLIKYIEMVENDLKSECTFVFLEQVEEESPVSDSQLLVLTSKRNGLEFDSEN